MNHLYMSTGHMLLSFVRTRDTGPWRRLANSGITFEQVRRELYAAYASGQADCLETP